MLSFSRWPYKRSLLALITVILVVGFFWSRLEAHHIASKDVFVGNLYNGKFLPFIYNKNKAITYLEMATDKKVIEAYCDLGDIYSKEKNQKLAYKNYLLGSMAGSQRCEFHILKYSYPDEKIAYEFFKYTADKYNYPSAVFMVGKRLVEGDGTKKNAVLGLSYLEKAAKQNHRGARIYLAGVYIKGGLVPQDIRKANILMNQTIKY